MSDPRLNSIHLGLEPRRERFRQARQMILDERGSQTIVFEGAWMPRVLNDCLGPLLERVAGSGFALRDGDHWYPLKIGINTIGRLPNNDIVLHDDIVSRRHCTVLVHTDGTCDLHDTASLNGTYLNGRRLEEPATLLPGDHLHIAGRQVVFTTGDGPPSISEDHDTRMM